MPPPPSPSASPAPKPTNFAFPFRGADKKPIVDEHILHGWLAAEPTGNFAFSQSGMWHGGIHVSADGAGKQLDLAHGVRCIADGHVIAYLIHRDYLISEIAAGESEAAQTAQYSRAFALVRHTLEYPANNRLTFFSLYMHLQSLEDYRRQGMAVPIYWPKAYEVTEYATSRPLPDPLHGAAAPDQVGQNIRSQPSLAGTVLGILQRGARVRIGTRSPDQKWGRIEAIESGTVLPPKVGVLPGQGAQAGWVSLAKEQGHWPLIEVVLEARCDQIATPAPIPIKAGDVIGHLGQYWRLEDPTQPSRQVHIEVFCDDALPAFLAASREAGRNITDFSKLPLLRIDQGVKLYKGPSVDEEGKDAPQTAVVQIYSQAALDALPAENKGPKDNAYGNGQPWWKITSANSLHNDITGWVRNRQMPGGRVTRESPHTWQDFEVFDMSDSHPTLFESTDAWLDHALREDKPDIHHVSKLSPLTVELYRALSPMRTESNAAFELCAHGENRWTRLRASRLIPKHRSEWASRTQYEDFFETALKRIQREPYLDAEIARIRQLTWWDEVSTTVSQPFPASPEVFHIHPVALVGNFQATSNCVPLEQAQMLALRVSTGFEGAHDLDYSAIAGNFDGMGMSYGLIQWNVGMGTLKPLLVAMRNADATSFRDAFDSPSNYDALSNALSSSGNNALFNWSIQQQSSNSANWKKPFKKLSEIQIFKDIQLSKAVSERHIFVMKMITFLRGISPSLMEKVELVSYCALFDLAVQQQTLTSAVNQINTRVLNENPTSQLDLVRITVEERAKTANHQWVSDCMSRRIGILQRAPFTYTAYGYTRTKQNANFKIISEDAHHYVCSI